MMRTNKLFNLLLFLLTVSIVKAQTNETVEKIVSEGYENSQLEVIAHELMDVYYSCRSNLSKSSELKRNAIGMESEYFKKRNYCRFSYYS